MNNVKTYNKGVESGLKVAQKIIEQEEEALDYLKSKIDLIVDGHDEMKNAVDHLIEDADENAITNMYGVCNPVLPNELKDHEQKVLINVLATLSTMQTNEAQKKYYNNLRHHLNIKGYEPDRTYDFRKIEYVESVKSLKTIAKAVRIFLFLEESNMNGIYKHEDDLFSHFELKSFNEIDAIIETIFCLFDIDGLIEFYGDFAELGKVDERNLAFLDVEEKEYLDISNECAQIYFKDCYIYDKNRSYIESSSYVIFNEGSDISCIHKISGIKKILLRNLEDSSRYIQKGKIATYQDMAYYVVNNDLFYINIDSMDTGKIAHISEEKDEDDTGKLREVIDLFINIGSMNTGKIAHISEEKDDKGKLCEVSELIIYKGRKIIYKNGNRNYIMDFEKGEESIKYFFLFKESRKCFMRGDYLYYIAMEDLDDDEEWKIGFRLKRYGILNDQETNVSEVFGIHSMDDSIRSIYSLVVDGINDDKFFCIFEYEGDESMERVGFDCFYFNMDYIDAKPHNFHIWNSRVFQIEEYKQYLIYVNADKGYSLIKHDFVQDKKTVLHKNYGKTEKSSFVDRLLLGKSSFMNASRYMRLGKWLWINEDDNTTPRIISIC